MALFVLLMHLRDPFSAFSVNARAKDKHLFTFLTSLLGTLNWNCSPNMKVKIFLLNKTLFICVVNWKSNSPKLISGRSILAVRIAKFGPLRETIRTQYVCQLHVVRKKFIFDNIQNFPAQLLIPAEWQTGSFYWITSIVFAVKCNETNNSCKLCALKFK